MATGYIYNGFGHYEERDGEQGIALKYAGLEFWLPYQKVTPIPNWTLREVDHDKSTPQGDAIGELVYMNVIVNGQRIVEELTAKQIPVPQKDMGIIPIQGKSTGKMIEVPSGCSAEGVLITSEVMEKEPTRSEVIDAESKALAYKQMIIAEYFQSKRERMTGGHGRLHPDSMTRAFMNELGVEDLDDVTAHAKNAGFSPESLRKFGEELVNATSEAIAGNLATAVNQVRTSQKAQLAPSRKKNHHLNLAENKAKWDAEHPEEAIKE